MKWLNQQVKLAVERFTESTLEDTNLPHHINPAKMDKSQWFYSRTSWHSYEIAVPVT